jgi:hypothetical protein
MNRQDMYFLIDKASDMPVQVRVAARLFLSKMSDIQIAQLGQTADSVMAKISARDRIGFEQALLGIGLPANLVTFLSTRAFAPGATNAVGNTQIN